MRTTVVTGLLGSGKTTFIRNFLDGRTEKAVVLVNDFGQAGIDGEIISAGGIETIELPSGCVCCTLKPDLISSIRRAVAEHGPEHLVIEPSGVASPSGVLEALGSAGVGPASVIGIVDAAEFADLYGSGMYGNFFREQIELSDTILLNKSDIATDDQIAEAESLITDINPGAVVFRTVNARIDPPLPIGERTEVRGDVDTLHPLPLQERVRQAHHHERLDRARRGPVEWRAGARSEPAHPLPIGERNEVRGDVATLHPLPLQERAGARSGPGRPLPVGERSEVRGSFHCSFESLSFRLQSGIALFAVRSLFHTLASGSCGSVIRAKALVTTDNGPYRFDLVYGKIDIVPFAKDITDSRLVVIGEDLDEGGIRRALAAHEAC